MKYGTNAITVALPSGETVKFAYAGTARESMLMAYTVQNAADAIERARAVYLHPDNLRHYETHRAAQRITMAQAAFEVSLAYLERAKRDIDEH